MSSILEWLSGGDLRSDGAANRVVDAVLKDPELITEVSAGLEDRRDVVRGRSADVLEKVARQKPEEFHAHIDMLVNRLSMDAVPMVRWHLAMLLGHLSVLDQHHPAIGKALIERVKDESVFTASWSIVSLCILARVSPAFHYRAYNAISSLSKHPSKAIRAKVRHALPLLAEPSTPFPSGWIESKHVERRIRVPSTHVQAGETD